MENQTVTYVIERLAKTKSRYPSPALGYLMLNIKYIGHKSKVSEQRGRV